MSWPQRRSRSGAAATMASTSATSTSWRPSGELDVDAVLDGCLAQLLEAGAQRPSPSTATPASGSPRHSAERGAEALGGEVEPAGRGVGPTVDEQALEAQGVDRVGWLVQDVAGRAGGDLVAVGPAVAQGAAQLRHELLEAR